MSWIGDVLGESLRATGALLLVALGPPLLLALLLKGVEGLVSARLRSRLGWRGVLLTGWIGVPVHELSHAAACLLFGHRVERVRLFAPDPATGQLGAVQHSWNKRNVYQQAGRFVIGMAPLAGGAASLWLATALLLPAATTAPVAQQESIPLLVAEPVLVPLGQALGSVGQAIVASARDLGQRLLDLDALCRPLTWLYLYLCLCVGMHLAPSRSDLVGAWPGLLLLAGLLWLAQLAAVLLGGSVLAPAAALPAVAATCGLLSLALVLVALSAPLVFLLTAPFRERAG